MVPRPALRPFTQLLARRGFQTTRTRSAGHQTHVDQFFHYPEGPRSNLPFNPLTRFFYIRYYAFWITAFSIPFASSYWMAVKEQ
ncbi:cytochrome-c oxidase chain VIIc-like protein [Microthyrium microscopicum]|uniref:Cytochrome c oxidase subunit 8, mitochondrial n=1 Tax=Microthyrium microscopicum TaxID=703497 RepID=A0A6A6TZ34_9PEZI|nr:cytochrome-c oxidase chain VIIc-like protein [Microthyrium microscopicum]